MENYFDQQVEMSTKSILALFETTKEQRRSFVNDILQRLEDGEVDPLEVHLQVKAMEDVILQLTSTDKEKNKGNLEAAMQYKNILIDAFANRAAGQKSFDFHNSKFTVMEAGAKYHYENCNDPELHELYEQQKKLVEKIKAKEKFLQNVPSKGQLLTSEETGETYMVYPPYKTSTTTISVKLK
jgi:hypothetical protein